ncbi:BAH domain-containing protein/TFIIS_M domain-containing protein, partial [Cephalotus follicularis]
MKKMRSRRFTQVDTSDDEDDVVAPPPKTRSSASKPEDTNTAIQSNQRKRKRMALIGEDDEDEEVIEEKSNKGGRKRKETAHKEEDGADGEDDEEDAPQEDAKPLGGAVRVSGKGRTRRSHYEAFEFDGSRYDLEDPVLLVPEDKEQKPYVAIIKDITQTKDGSMMVTGQWFYRPEEAEKKGGGSWQSRDIRELFYSFHRDEVPAESVMHKCVVHFVPIHKQLPSRKQHPGFIVQKVYDTVERKLWKLTDKDYEDSKQHEIDLLVLKTISRLGDLPDLEIEETAVDHEEQAKTKRTLKKRNLSPLDVPREEEATTRPDQHPKVETPGSCAANASEYHAILAKFKALTGDSPRDKWLERLLQGIQYICSPPESMEGDDKRKVDSDDIDYEKDNKCLEKSGKSFLWPDAAIPAVTALEQASHDALSSEYQKYNQKMRQLVFNLKNNAVLARRLLNGELEPAKVPNMSPTELKMTDARCRRCNEFKVGLRDIIQAGHGDRYQLECTACGNSWYASRDEASTLTMDGPSSAKSVGTAPWATAKFENIEKKLVSPREAEKSTNDVFKKTSEAYMPFFETQKSFGKSKKEDNPDLTRKA